MDSTSDAPSVVGSAADSPLTRVFISHRRSDSPGTAWALYQRLAARLGRENVFFDYASIDAGARWLEEIKTHLGGAHVLLALIGERWSALMDERTRRAEEDYVCTEIETALRDEAVTVIPLLIDSTPPPEPRDLPTSIRSLSDGQAFRLRHESLEADIDSLMRRLLGDRSAGQRSGGGAGETAGEDLLWADGDSAPVTPGGEGADGEPVVYPRPRISRDAPHAPAESRSEGPPRPLSGVYEPDDEHYEAVAQQILDDNIVIFVGAGINAEDEPDLPDDAALADLIAERAKLSQHDEGLAEVAQLARVKRGEDPVFRWIGEGFGGDYKPGPVHRYLAGLPSRLEALGLERHHPMIVTSKYDVALERAFGERSERYDVAMYVGARAEAPAVGGTGGFRHKKWNDTVMQPTDPPNRYEGFPFTGVYGPLKHTVIVRLNGSVGDPQLNYTWSKNYVVTQDHYIDYLAGRAIEDVVPVQILAKLRSASCLFLGYTMADWRLRVFLRRVWPGERFGHATHWAVHPSPTAIERDLWQSTAVPLYRCSPQDYLDGLDRYLGGGEPRS
jgi:hypothetical protein